MYRRILFAVLNMTVVGAFSAPLIADVVVLTSLKDNTLIEITDCTFSEPYSNGAGDGIFAGRTGFNGCFTILRGILAFDVAGAIPAGSTIENVSLTLELIIGALGDSAQTHRLNRLLADWGEGLSENFGGLGMPATPSDATWLHTYFPGQFWGVQGGDFSGTVSASLSVDVFPGSHTWGPTAQMISDVQSWLNTPASNYGWILRGNETDVQTARKFGSRQHFVPSSRPRLTIEFTPPPCAGDINEDGVVNPQDLALLLGAWGNNPGHPADINDDNMVNPQDLALLLGNWGPCP